MTAAMLRPTGLLPFAQRFPDRVYDVGIAEQHAVASAAGLAFGGLHPVVAIYATFMNRAFDQVLMDVALHRAGVTFVLDRAGVTGPDGPSHHGIWDLAMLQLVPHIRIAVPARRRAAARGAARGRRGRRRPDRHPLPQGRRQRRPAGHRAPRRRRRRARRAPTRRTCSSSASARWRTSRWMSPQRLRAQGIGATVIDPRWVVPVQPSIVELAASHRLVITIEDGIRVGGIGTRVRQVLREAGVDTAVDELGVPDEFIDHASREQILEDAGLTPRRSPRMSSRRCSARGSPSPVRATSEIPTIPRRLPQRRLTHRQQRCRTRESGGPPLARTDPPSRRAGELAADALDHRVVEGVAEDALRGALAVEVGRRAAVDERPAGAEDEAQVDVLDLGDHALVEHDLDLLGEAVLHAAEDLGLASTGDEPTAPLSTFSAAFVQPVTRPLLSFSTTSGSSASWWKFSDA